MFLLTILLSAMNVQADVKPSKEVLSAIYNASQQYNIDINLMFRIAYIESHFNSNAIRHNKNNTIDYGLFQINSVHWQHICKEYNIMNIKGNSLCAAKLLSIAKKHKDRDNRWPARFHSKTPSKKKLYFEKIAKANIDFVR